MRSQPKPVTIVLHKRLRDQANASLDPIVQLTVEQLEAFRYYTIVRERYDWKYLPHDAFVTNYLSDERILAKNGIRDANLAFLSHLVRIIEAFEVAATWRAADLLIACVRTLNDEHLVSACALARALLETSVVYFDAHNTLRSTFEDFPWAHIGSHLLQLDERSGDGKLTGIESYIERLMAGTRLGEFLKETPDLEQKNILSILRRVDKGLLAAKAGYQVMPTYELLCDITHPNLVGFARYLERIDEIGNGWIVKAMAEKARGQNAEKITESCLWSISFSAGTIIAGFGEFQQLKKSIVAQIGAPLPVQER